MEINERNKESRPQNTGKVKGVQSTKEWVVECAWEKERRSAGETDKDKRRLLSNRSGEWRLNECGMQNAMQGRGTDRE